MPEYIERDAAIKRIKEYALSVFGVDLDNSQEYAGRSLPENYCEGLYEATELVDDLPAADVVPVRHGRWLDGKCTVCGWEEPDVCTYDGYETESWVETPYCPKCGAKMDLKTQE